MVLNITSSIYVPSISINPTVSLDWFQGCFDGEKLMFPVNFQSHDSSNPKQLGE
jgi:hypothetical protein